MLRAMTVFFSKFHDRDKTDLRRVKLTRGPQCIKKPGQDQSAILELPAVATLLKSYQAWDQRQLRLHVRVPVPAAEKAGARVEVNGKELVSIRLSARPRGDGASPYTEQIVELPLEMLEQRRGNKVEITVSGPELPDPVLENIGFCVETPAPRALHDEPQPDASEPNRDKQPGRQILFHNTSALRVELVFVDEDGIERNPITREPRKPGQHTGLIVDPCSFAGPACTQDPNTTTTYPGALHRVYLVDTDDVDNLVGFHVVGDKKEQNFYINIQRSEYNSDNLEKEIYCVDAGIEKLDEPVRVAGNCYEYRTVLRFGESLFSKRGARDTLNGLLFDPSNPQSELLQSGKKGIELRVLDFETRLGKYTVHEFPLDQPTSDPDDTSLWERFEEGNYSGIRRVVRVPFENEREFNYAVVARPVSSKSPLALASDPVDVIRGGGGHGGSDF